LHLESRAQVSAGQFLYVFGIKGALFTEKLLILAFLRIKRMALLADGMAVP
jgi:hypothetical protein